MKFFIFFLILLSSSLIRNETVSNRFVIWNVGQGQFTTQISDRECRHFDMGGEFFPWDKIKEHCLEKENKIYLSHWDWDHIGGLKYFVKIAQNKTSACLALLPLGPSSKKKINLLKKIPLCPKENLSSLKIWTPSFAKFRNSNSLSNVVLNDKILIPGDSTIQEESKWSGLPWIRKTKILVLGHHGSKTSTSDKLLLNLRNIKLTISSARWQRYHHPHPKVEARLAQAKIPLLRTEDWGNIWIETGPVTEEQTPDKTIRGKDGTPYEGHGPQAHNRHNHYKHSNL